MLPPHGLRLRFCHRTLSEPGSVRAFLCATTLRPARRDRPCAARRHSCCRGGAGSSPSTAPHSAACSCAAPRLRTPVAIYALVLTGMALSALLRRQAPGGDAALLGASLFVLSDSALGLRKFVGPWRGAQGIILSAYWSGIACIAWSAQGAAD
ncbi:MAG: lysoplasmalogenase [Solimonas sp.]